MRTLADRLGGNPAISVEYLETRADSGSATTYTFAGVSFGNVAATRIIAVAIMSASSSDTISSVTIGGVAATSRGEQVSSGAHTAIYTASSSGTSGDVVVTFGSSHANCAISVYSVKNYETGYNANILSTVASGVGTMDLSITLPSKGVVIASCYNINNVNHTWSGLTRDVYQGGFDVGLDSYSSSSGYFSTSGSKTIDITFSSSTGDKTGVAVSFV